MGTKNTARSSTRVLVLGGGFAGVESAIQLRKRGFEVTLVSDRDYLFIYPISIWIPMSGIAFDDACQPVAPLAKAHGFTFKVAPVTGADFAARTVTTLAEGGPEEVLAYDELVVAFGGGKTPADGVEHTLSPCDRPQTILEIKARYEALIERARALKAEGGDARIRIGFGFGGNPKDPSAVRGGPVFELLFNVMHHLKQLKLRDQFDLTFFAPMAEPAKKMGAKVPARMRAWLEKKAVAWEVGTPITGFDREGVALKDGRRLDFDLTIFTPAGAGLPLARTFGLPLNAAGFVRITPHCQVVGVPHVWAAGDAAALEGPDWIAKQGHVAEAMGKVIAQNLASLVDAAAAAAAAGATPPTELPKDLHSYQDHLSILCVMDTGNGATLVMRNDKHERMIPAPVVGHWMKKAWGTYWKKSKLRQLPRLPGA